jgi:hypothetical protein
MTDYVAFLHDLLPFQETRSILLACGVVEARRWGSDFLAYLYCEVVKLLRHEKILQPLPKYATNQAMFSADVASKAATALLLRLERASGLQLPVHSAECEETAQVLHLPLAQLHSVNVCKVCQLLPT